AGVTVAPEEDSHAPPSAFSLYIPAGAGRGAGRPGEREPAGLFAPGRAGGLPETLRRLSRREDPEGWAGPDHGRRHRPRRSPRDHRGPGKTRRQPAVADDPEGEDAAGGAAPRAGTPHPAQVDRGGGARAGPDDNRSLGLPPA